MRIPEAPLGDLPLLSAMPFAGMKMTSRSIGLVACVLGLGMLFAAPADARKPTKQQRAYAEQRASVRGLPRNNGNTVCWTTCGQPGSIVMGRDPDPFIRSQILRDASGFFGGQP
jgi:hypothetical protein